MIDDQAWVCGFQKKLGYTPSSAAEVLAIREGLLMCKQLNLNKILMFTDSLDAMRLLMGECGLAHPLRQEVTEIRSLLADDWDIELHHSHREALRCADTLARDAHENDMDLVILQEPPRFCLAIMRQDMVEAILGSIS